MDNARFWAVVLRPSILRSHYASSCRIVGRIFHISKHLRFSATHTHIYNIYIYIYICIKASYTRGLLHALQRSTVHCLSTMPRLSLSFHDSSPIYVQLLFEDKFKYTLHFLQNHTIVLYFVTLCLNFKAPVHDFTIFECLQMGIVLFCLSLFSSSFFFFLLPFSSLALTIWTRIFGCFFVLHVFNSCIWCKRHLW